MKKLLLNIVCLVALFATGTSLKAQEIRVTLDPGWNWISYPNAVAMEVNEALATFTPMDGDMVKGPFSFASYYQGQWTGGLTHFMPGMGYMYCSLRTETTSFVFGQASSASVVTATPTNITTTSALVGGTVTINEGNHIFARGVCWGTEPNPDIDGSHTADAIVTGSLSDTLTELTSNTTYYVRAYVVTDYGLTYGNQQSFTTVVEYQYVDLGLPSGTLWATCNVGATSPEDYGDYFAWGETEPKGSYAWSTYQYCNGSYNTLTKYCNKSSYGFNGFTDNLTTLLPEDDVATANWGDGWRMPTQAEFQELLDNTTLTWTQQNGVNGRLFTASNGNSLFLPAAGYRGSSSLNDAGSYGDYWSSSFNSDYPGDAWRLHFSAGNYGMNRSSRYYGQSVRPVRSTSQNTSFIIDATANPAEGGEVSGGGTYQESVECTLTATPNEGYTFSNWTENGEVVSVNATYTFTVNADRTLVANFTSNGGGDDHEYVDLGLPSGLLWATCNVGADNPEDYGDYFAWGETQPKEYYGWSTYQHCNGSSTSLIKYCSNPSYGYYGFTDNLTTLLPEDDAATANWGTDWRMPTREEWEELYNNTTVTEIVQNDVNGCLFTASNGNSLFLPNSGSYGNYEEGGGIEKSKSVFLLDAGNSCYRGYDDGNMYWSSSLESANYPHYAYSFEPIIWSYTDNGNRPYGLPVRPVRSTSQNKSFIIDATANPAEGGEVSGGGTYQEGAECTLTATPNEGYTFSNWTENDEVVSAEATYTFTVNANRTLVANFTQNGSYTHPYVDLGLPSGLLWATCNVGADNPEDYGDYFAWGETQPKSTYNWSTYQYCNNSSYGYNGFTDNLTTLLPEDDAATANWGNGWRMPTQAEFQELLNNTTVTWTTRNGVNGRLFTASNGNSLFLPAAGYRYYSSLFSAGSYGKCWASSLNTGNPYYAWLLLFNSDYYDVNIDSRFCGNSVRAVRSSGQN